MMPQPPRQAEGEDRDGVAVGAEGHEARHAEVEEAGVAEVHREAGRREGVRDRHRADADSRRCCEDGAPIHGAYPSLSLRPEKALRSDQQDEDQHDEGARVLEVGRHSEQRRHLDDEADDERAEQRAERGAEAAERDGGEDQQQHLRAHVPLDAGAEVRPQDAGERGERTREDPHDPDDAVDVDAGCRGELRVVGDGARRLADPGAQQEVARRRGSRRC